MKQIFLTFSLIISIHLQSASAATLKIAESGALVNFEAIGKPALIKIKGEGKKVSGSFKATPSESKGFLLLNGEVSVSLSEIDTGIALRNEHMRDKYLEVKKYPDAKVLLKDFKIENKVLDDAAGMKEGEWIKGETMMELHGERKSITIEYQFNGREIRTQFEIKISDFKIPVPSYMGVTVADMVKVKLVAPVSRLD